MIWLALLLIVLSPWALFGMYAGVMRLKEVRDAGKLTTPQKVFGYPWLVIGLVIDFIVNVVFGTLVFLQLPHEWTVSTRVWRLSTGEPSWRQRVALTIRKELLDSIDPSGVHRG